MGRERDANKYPFFGHKKNQLSLDSLRHQFLY